VLFEDRDGLQIPVLIDAELVFREAADCRAVVGDDHVDENEVGLNLQRGGRCLRRDGSLRGWSGCRSVSCSRLGGTKKGQERDRGNGSNGAETSHGRHLRWSSEAPSSCLKQEADA